MAKVNNDKTKYMAKPFLIAAQRRSGGTFLSHCLSNHPQVFCDRAETVHHSSVWLRYTKRKIPTPQIVAMLCNQEGYMASGCKMVYNQFFETKMRKSIMEMYPRPRIIHLTRDNKLRQAVSICFNQNVRKGKAPFFPIHTVEETRGIFPSRIDPHRVIRTIEWIMSREKYYTGVLKSSGLRVLHITYTDMVGREGKTGKMNKTTAALICQFIGVRRMSMGCELKRVHSHPLSAWLANYQEFSNVISKSRYAAWLEDEKVWQK